MEATFVELVDKIWKGLLALVQGRKTIRTGQGEDKTGQREQGMVREAVDRGRTGVA